MGKKKQVRFTLGFENRMNIVKSDAINAIIRERGIYRLSAIGNTEMEAVENLVKRIELCAYDVKYRARFAKVCEKWLAFMRGKFNVGEVSMLRDGDARCCICKNRLFECEGAFFSDGKYNCFSCDPRMNEVSYTEHLRTGKVFKSGICGVALHDAANTAGKAAEAEYMELLNADEPIAPNHQFAKCVACGSLGQATNELMRQTHGVVFCSSDCRENILNEVPYRENVSILGALKTLGQLACDNGEELVVVSRQGGYKFAFSTDDVTKIGTTIDGFTHFAPHDPSASEGKPIRQTAKIEATLDWLERGADGDGAPIIAARYISVCVQNGIATLVVPESDLPFVLNLLSEGADKRAKHSIATSASEAADGFSQSASLLSEQISSFLTGKHDEAVPAVAVQAANAEWFMVSVGGNDVHRAEVKTPNGTVIVTIGLCGRMDGEYDGKRCAAYSLFHKGYKHEWEAPICILDGKVDLPAEARYAVEWSAHVANGCQSDSVYKGEIKE